MGNGVSIDQGNLPSYGIRDVGDAADRKQHDWSQLAEAPITKQSSIALLSPRKPYSGAQTRGRELLEDRTQLDPYSGDQLRGLKSEDDIYSDASYSVDRVWDWESSKSAESNGDTYSDARLRDLESEDDTQPNIFNDALSSVMEDDSGYNTWISTWESAESANTNQLRQRRQSASGSAEDGEVRAEVNGSRENRKKSTTSTEIALPKSTNAC